MMLRSLAIIFLITGVIIFGAACFHRDAQAGGGQTTDLPETVSFNFNIRPILSDKCFKCHGPDANHREAHLRLDIADSAYAPLQEPKGLFAIVPGKPEQSELVKRITSSDVSYAMPPSDAHLGSLT